MKLLVCGAQGMLGRDLIARLEDSPHEVIAGSRIEFDITRKRDLHSRIQGSHPDIVINCAAYTTVDKAESEPEKAFAVNRDGAANLAAVCRESRTPLIHVSTDYVFDGKMDRPYREDDPVNPLGVYGRSKLEGEKAVQSMLTEHIIIRTSWLFGVHGSNFVKTMLRFARERDELRVVADQRGCPTWTGHLADALLEISRQTLEHSSNTPWGTYHFCGSGETSWHEFATAIIAEGRLRENLKVARILPITTAEYPTPARRPAISILDCTKIESAFGIKPEPWRTGLATVVKEYLSR
jgi:dTDP-4-dehydrorhamnose reductase